MNRMLIGGIVLGIVIGIAGVLTHDQRAIGLGALVSLGGVVLLVELNR